MNAKNFFFLIFLLSISLFQISTLEENNSSDESNEYIKSLEEMEEHFNSISFRNSFVENDEDESELKGLFGGTNDCLMDKSQAIKVLKDSYGIDNSNPDDNLRFILGKCSPALLIPGIYATKLVVELQCKSIATEEKSTTLKDLRLYCGDSICKDETTVSEEHALFLGALEPAFTIIGGFDKYSSCLGYIMNFFQNPNECPNVNNKNLCFYSKYIKVGYYGGTTKTLDKSRCGVEGVQNVIQTGKLQFDEIINFGAAQSFNGISNALLKKGYKEGFSLAAVPNDFRRYIHSNNFASKVFETQINRLYANTGKPVVIVAHSFGTLITLSNLIKRKGDAAFLKKIKKFIAIAPPFAGATKLLEAFLHGLNDWNKEIDFFGKKIKITNYNIFGQLFMYKSLPTLTELRPQSIAAKLFNDPAYKELGEALKARINTERECKKTNCAANTIKTNTAKFDAIFKGYFPSLTDAECAFESSIGGNTNTYNRKCYTNIYNIADCPSLVTKSVGATQEGLDNDVYCGKTGPNYYYQGECTSGRNCLDKIYYETNKCPYVFKNTEAVNYLLNRFNNDYSSKFGRLDNSYFDSYNQVKEGVKASMDHQDRNSLIKNLPLPPVDTDLVYASYAPTINMVVANDNDFASGGGVLKRGGDETVPAWSSLLTGLKWIYDMKKDSSYKNKVRLVEYCSRLAEKGQYKYDANKQQTFAALSCKCLTKKNEYDSKYSSCTHAAMLNDRILIDYVNSIVDDPKETANVTPTKKNAAKSYKPSDFDKVCSNQLKSILDTAK